MIKILNFRTLGKKSINNEGRKIKPNTIFRSGTVSFASRYDIRRLKSLGIKDIYDFRGNKELISMPPISDDLINTHSFDILGAAAHADAKAYLHLTKEELNKGVISLYAKDFAQTEKYREVIATILKQENPEFLFHCTAGKDRTGIFGAILMMILDFDKEAIIKEHLAISNISVHINAIFMLKKSGVKRKDVDLNKFEGILRVFPEYLDAYYDSILKNHKNIDEYLKEKVGITPEIKTELKERYLI